MKKNEETKPTRIVVYVPGAKKPLTYILTSGFWKLGVKAKDFQIDGGNLWIFFSNREAVQFYRIPYRISWQKAKVDIPQPFFKAPPDDEAAPSFEADM